MEFHANVTFVRKHIKAFDRRTSRYRRKGKIIIDDFYLTIKGRHVYSLIPRTIIGLILFFLSRSIVIEFIDKVLRLQFDKPITLMEGILDVFLVILSFYLVENVILAKEDFTVGYDAVDKFAAYPEHKLVLISISDLPRCSPVMFRCEKWEELIRLLKKEIPEKEFLPDNPL